MNKNVQETYVLNAVACRSFIRSFLFLASAIDSDRVFFDSGSSVSLLLSPITIVGTSLALDISCEKNRDNVRLEPGVKS